MDLKNATEFDRVVTRIFTVLAEAFPKPVDFGFQAIGLADGPAHETKDFSSVVTEYTPQHEFAAQCVSFLISEGYVSGNPQPTWARNVLLTDKGLELIKAKPDSLLPGTY
jgi:hypothetical protein|nr:MAG TPA: YjcQ protein [Inoviridae sp.]